MRQSSTGLKRIVTIYLGFVFFSNFSTILYFLTSYLLVSEYTVESISLLLLAYQAAKFALEIPTGYIADRFGRKQSGLIGLAGLAMYYLTLIFLPNMPWMLAAFAVKGFAISCISGSFESLFIDSIPQQAILRYNVLERILFYFSYALPALLGGLIAQEQAFGIGLVVDIAAIGATAACAISFPVIEDARREKTDVSPRPLTSSLLAAKPMWPLYLMDLSQAFAYVSVEDFFAPVLSQAGISYEAAGAILAAQLVLSSLAGLAVPALLKRFPRQSFYNATGVIRIALTAFFLCPAINPWLRAVFYTAQVTAYALFAPLKYELFQKKARPELRCTLISIQSLMVSLGALLFYALSTLLSNALTLNTELLLALATMSTIYIPCLLKTATWLR